MFFNCRKKLLYTRSMSLGMLCIGLMKTYNAEVYGYLFGSVLSVTPEEIRIIGALSILVLGLLLVFSKELYFIAFGQEMAEARGASLQAEPDLAGRGIPQLGLGIVSGCQQQRDIGREQNTRYQEVAPALHL